MICKNCGETMSGDGIKTALHCPSLDASDREPDAEPLHCDTLADDHPLWLVNAQILGLLDGEGASEDRENVSAFLRGTGLPASTVERMRRALCRSAQPVRGELDKRSIKLTDDMLRYAMAAMSTGSPADAEKFRRFWRFAMEAWRTDPKVIAAATAARHEHQDVRKYLDGRTNPDGQFFGVW